VNKYRRCISGRGAHPFQFENSSIKVPLSVLAFLRSGVDINTIRAWLGHVSLATTNVYAEVDLEMKARALANCEVKEEKPKNAWHQDKELMQFLKSL
jgi:hypothetical protein